MGSQDKLDNYFLKKKAQADGVETIRGGEVQPSAYANMSRDSYENAIRERNAKEAPTSAKEVSTSSAVTGAAQNMGAEMAQQGAQQGSIAGTAGGALMMSGNPYAMAAGLGLQVYAAGEQNKRAAKEQQRQEYNARIAKRQEMMSQIANMGIQ